MHGRHRTNSPDRMRSINRINIAIVTINANELARMPNELKQTKKRRTKKKKKKKKKKKMIIMILKEKWKVPAWDNDGGRSGGTFEHFLLCSACNKSPSWKLEKKKEKKNSEKLKIKRKPLYLLWNSRSSIISQRFRF